MMPEQTVRRAAVQRALIALVVVLGLATWFSVSAVATSLAREWAISSTGVVWLTASTQLGFVVGATASSIVHLADLIPAPVLLAGGAFGAALTTTAFAIFSHDLSTAIPLRFLVGIFLAGVYPVGMKLMASWSPGAVRGRALGLLIGALTLGSAMPHLVGALTLPWRGLVAAAAAMTALGGVICLVAVRTGPLVSGTRTAFDARFVVRLFLTPGPMHINAGYLGHMWELYALWTWLPLFVAAAIRGGDIDPGTLSFAMFCAIGVAGAAGCLLGGWIADRLGRSTAALGALATSGLCCILSPLAYGTSPSLLLAFTVVWGAAVIADSGPFSTMLSEAVDQTELGTALTAQTAAGFALTAVSIQLIPLVAAVVGWRWALTALAVGPILGVISIVRLRAIAPKGIYT